MLQYNDYILHSQMSQLHARDLVTQLYKKRHQIIPIPAQQVSGILISVVTGRFHCHEMHRSSPHCCCWCTSITNNLFHTYFEDNLGEHLHSIFTQTISTVIFFRCNCAIPGWATSRKCTPDQSSPFSLTVFFLHLQFIPAHKSDVSTTDRMRNICLTYCNHFIGCVTIAVMGTVSIFKLRPVNGNA